jgi:hypothetical protein
MLPNTLSDISNIIDEAKSPLAILVVADGCENEMGTVQKDVETQIINYSVVYFSMCIPEEKMSFPRVATPTLYFFLPKNQTPVFWRTNNIQATLQTDIGILMKMNQGQTYEEARFTESERKHIQEVDSFLQEEKSTITKFPSPFQQARNLAKEMWKTGKNAARGLPVLVTADLAFERFSTCEACPKFDKASTRCSECGCFMKTKTHLASASCPIGNWSAVT